MVLIREYQAFDVMLLAFRPILALFTILMIPIFLIMHIAVLTLVLHIRGQLASVYQTKGFHL